MTLRKQIILHLYTSLTVALLLSTVALPQDNRLGSEQFARRVAVLRMAITDLTETFPVEYPNSKTYLADLAEIERRAGAKSQTEPGGLEKEFAALQRRALLANPLVCSKPILYVARAQYVPDHHNTATLFKTGEINTGNFRGSGALKTIDFADACRVRTLIETSDGLIRDPDVHFSGTRILFAMRRNIDDDYHIYEINSDGSGLRQLTSAPGVADFDPVYLPDDSIVFSSTREPKYCMCNRHIMGNLFRMDADGANIHQIGKSTLHEGHSALTPDGRIIYDRWEYVDRNFGDAQGLWTVNPDGTNHAVYWGNNTWSPGGVIDARIIPDSGRAVCVFGSCHDRPWGALAVIDRRGGVDGRASVIRTWPADAVNLVREKGPKPDAYGFDNFKRLKLKYEDPYPLGDKYFLCSRMIGNGEQMGLYLVDVFGNELLLHFEQPGCFDPMPLAPRPRPPVIPTRRDFENKPGHFYVLNVYQGTHMQGIKLGAVKYLRVVESPEKRFWTRSEWGGQGVHCPAINWHGFENKRILGTVPVEEDGSAYFETPADKFIYFQLLDADGMMIQSMRSGTIVQSGESTGCTGCHENRRTVPTGIREKIPIALRRSPSKLKGWYGEPRLFNYIDEVQPVFNKHCLGCHDFGGEGGKKLVLAGDRTNTFNVSYNELWRKKYIKSIGAGPSDIQSPYLWGSHASRLVQVLRSGHNDVKLTREQFDRIVTWIDINGPYYPRYDTAYPNNLTGRSPLDNNQIKRLTELTQVPFSKLGSHTANTGPQVCFDRPDMSPCLSKFTDKSDPRYVEALTIIEAGRKMLLKRPRADMAGFEPCPVDRKRQETYTSRQKIEQQNRLAISSGEKNYDIRPQ